MTGALALVPLTDKVWSEFWHLNDERGAHLSVDLKRPQQGVWVVWLPPVGAATLAVGCCIYDTDGQMLIAEHLVANERVPLKTRYRAFNIALDALRTFATVRSKWIVAHPSKKNLAQYLGRRGFKFANVGTMTTEPGLTWRMP